MDRTIVIEIKDLFENYNKVVEIQELLNKCNFENYDITNLKDIYNNVNKCLKNCDLDNCDHELHKLIQSKDDKLIEKFFDKCVDKCTKEGKFELMLLVAILLPHLVVESYERPIVKLMKQITYVKVPNNLCGYSIRENLWSYKFPYQQNSPSWLVTKLLKLETIPRHSTTLCYVPLPGLCTYPETTTALNALFPRDLSPFAKLILFNNSSGVLSSKASYKEISRSPPFQAIVKFKWHTFARWRYFGLFFIKLAYSGLFAATVNTGIKQLMIASIICGTFIAFLELRRNIVFVMNNVNIRTIITHSIPLRTLVSFFSLITVTIWFLLQNDKSTHSFLQRSLLGVPQSLSMFLLWIDFIGLLLVFKNTAIIYLVIAHICRRIVWLLLFLFIVLIASAHVSMIYLSVNPPDKGVNTFKDFQQSFNNVWSWFLNDYTSMNQWTDNRWMKLNKVVFPFFITIVILNLLIALVNNVYNEIYVRAKEEWSLLRSRAVVEVELLFMTPSERQNRDYFPWIIIYEAFTEDVEKWPQILKEENGSSRCKCLVK